MSGIEKTKSDKRGKKLVLMWFLYLCKYHWGWNCKWCFITMVYWYPWWNAS